MFLYRDNRYKPILFFVQIDACRNVKKVVYRMNFEQQKDRSNKM